MNQKDFVERGCGESQPAMNQNVLSYSDLVTLSGYKSRSPAQIAAWLQSENIRYAINARGKPFTTIDAVNKALGVNMSHPSPEKPVVEVR